MRIPDKRHRDVALLRTWGWRGLCCRLFPVSGRGEEPGGGAEKVEGSMNSLRVTCVCRSKNHLGSATLSRWRAVNGAQTNLGLCRCCPKRFEPLRAGQWWLLLLQTSHLPCGSAQWLMQSQGILLCDFFAEAPEDAERSHQVARRADHGHHLEGDRTGKRPLGLPSFVLSRSLLPMERVAEGNEEQKFSLGRHYGHAVWQPPHRW
jgi:hypothetical protein